ncbi:MAG: single-stranded-DNA-specific exonuclease RecJ [bacterium]|jgi:single-stranded-DNA-specific exonuclease|nr:single-stranded-DNA-specific exonuclease RecJ [bacterium]
MDLLWEHPGDLQQDQRVAHVAKTLSLPPAIAAVLVGNGVGSPDAAEAFFNPGRDQLIDPNRFRDMEKALDCLTDALMRRRRIAVYGDYDVDGVTSVALLYLFLKDVGGDVFTHIPVRNSEGYGLSIEGVESIRARGASVLVTVDTGITALEEIAHARDAGLEVVICDHHQPAAMLPAATAILNPKLPDEPYPFKELAAVGVTYKLCQALVERLGIDESVLEAYTDLVAIGSAADIVPLVGENRVLVSRGLAKINREPMVGVAALLQVAGLMRREVDVASIVFGLAPRINAVGRLGSADRAVRLLCTRNRETAATIAQVLESENCQRKTIDHDTLDEAMAEVPRVCDLERDRIIVLAREGWHSGVIGIVASRIIERYHRPTVMITIDEDGMGKGSARSIHGFDIYEALHHASDLLIQFGGHKYAAGLTIRGEKVPELRERLRLWTSTRLGQEDLKPRLRIDAEIPLRAVNRGFLEHVQRFAPFGPRNQMPHFLSRDLRVLGSPRVVGNGHLMLRVEQDGIEYDAIGYGLGHLADSLSEPDRGVDMVYSVMENNWRGSCCIQLQIKDTCLAGRRRIVPRERGREDD